MKVIRKEFMKAANSFKAKSVNQEIRDAEKLKILVRYKHCGGRIG